MLWSDSTRQNFHALKQVIYTSCDFDPRRDGWGRNVITESRPQWNKETIFVNEGMEYTFKFFFDNLYRSKILRYIQY